MRDAFGGSLMIGLLLTFILIYVAFMAVVVKYASAYRLKNYVINLVEQYEYNGGDTKFIEDNLVGKNVEKNNIAMTNHCASEKEADGTAKMVGGYAVCIVSRGDDDTTYYKVITYVSVSLPFFDIDWIVPISGETNIVRNYVVS